MSLTGRVFECTRPTGIYITNPRIMLVISHRSKCHIVVLLWILHCFLPYLSANLLSHEICDGETFEGRCESGQVMVMKSARYGRMSLGRCVKADLGHMGCFSDVLSLFDSWCSGKSTCSVFVNVVNEDLNAMTSCIAELRSYIEIEYHCIKVAMPSEAECRSKREIKLSATLATLSSHVTDETGCGSLNVPWVIQTPPGQRITVSMTDFGWAEDQMSPAEARCKLYGYISEPNLGINQTICGGRDREANVYQSTSNRVVLQVLPSSQREVQSSFLVNYVVAGCPDITPPLNVWYKRDGDTAVIGCEWSEHSWHLQCEGNNWVGVVGNCSKNVEATENVPQRQWSMSPLLSVSLIIGLGVLVVALFCIALIGCICILRNKSDGQTNGFQPSEQQQAFLYYPGRPIPVDQQNPPQAGNIHQPPGQSMTLTKPTTTDELIHIWETPLPIPKKDQSTTGLIDNSTTNSGVDTLPGPSQVHKDGSTMSRSDYSTDTYWAGTNRYFDNDLGWVTMPPKQ